MEREHSSRFRAMVKTPRPSPPRRLLSFRGGMGVVVDALAARLGPALQVDRPVQTLSRSGHGWRLTCARGVTVEADHVVLAGPAWASAAMVRDAAPELATSFGRVTYAGLSV